jgi:CDP-paratose 2-epimerase
MRCAVSGEPYRVSEYASRQVRDNIHRAGLEAAFDAFRGAPARRPCTTPLVGVSANCSMIEAIDLCEEIPRRPLGRTPGDEARMSDRRWWVSDLSKFLRHYPGRKPEHDLRVIHHQNDERLMAAA